ncbi:hypothetical protein ABG067_004901 [Albugo candida]
MEARLTKRLVALFLPLSISLALLNGYSSAFEASIQTVPQNSQLKRELNRNLDSIPFKSDAGSKHGRIASKFTTNVRNSGGYVRKKFDKAKEMIGAFISDKVKPRVMKQKDRLVAFTRDKIKPVFNKVKDKIKKNPTLQSARKTLSTKLDAIRKYRSSSKKRVGGTDDKTVRKDEKEITNARAGATSGSTTKDSQPTDVPAETSRLRQGVDTIKKGYSTAGKYISPLTEGLKSKATSIHKTVTSYIPGFSKKHAGGTDDKTVKKDENEITNARAGATSGSTTKDSQPTDVPAETSRVRQGVDTIKKGYSTAGKYISPLTEGLKSKATNMYESVTSHIGNAKNKLYEGATYAKAKIRDTFPYSGSNDKLRRPSPENGSNGQS